MAEETNHDHAAVSKDNPPPSTRAKTPPLSAYSSKIITIKVGTSDSEQTVYAHHDLLTFYSGYFRGALNGQFVEAQSGVIELRTEEPAVVQNFVRWLYTSKIRTDTTTAENCESHFSSCVKLWIFADARNIPLLMNEMVNLLQESVVEAWKYPHNVITQVYENTTKDSALRRMIIDLFNCISSEGVTKGCYEDFTEEFLFDLVERLASTKKRQAMGKKYREVEMCPIFHIHEEGVRCIRNEATANQKT